MLITSDELIQSFKISAKALGGDQSHCQKLKAFAQHLKFQSYNQFRSWVKKCEPFELEGLARRICYTRLPCNGGNYYSFTLSPDRKISFFSVMVGRDKSGREIRVPDFADPILSRKFSREGVPIYILETEAEFEIWRDQWLGQAFLSEILTQRRFQTYFWREKLVVR